MGEISVKCEVRSAWCGGRRKAVQLPMPNDQTFVLTIERPGERANDEFEVWCLRFEVILKTQTLKLQSLLSSRTLI
jgi:hypothetical protein